ncbi:tRNA 4-thiouridine(8) synthase ThiI [Bacillaceae bacterium]
MRYSHILLRYGELALKGKNRNQFENRLRDNVQRALRDYPKIKVKKEHGRMFVELNGEPLEPVLEKLRYVFGIVSFSPVVREELDIERIKAASLALMQSLRPFPRTFKVSARRTNKGFPFSSMELNHLVGAHVLRHTEDLKVDVHRPDVELNVEVRQEAAYINCEVIPGQGGLPVGSSGKAMLMLSGGIDSPVAGWMMMKRGMKVEAVHFHSYPFTSERARQKVVDLARILSRYGGEIKLHVVPFTEIQTKIREKCPEHYMITLMRRFMMRITERIAEKRGSLAIATGESLGQVASQTIESMHTINKVVQIPVLRPLVGMDKAEIMEIAKRIGTYETSILPYEDCCTVFTPKAPVTKPNPLTAERMEAGLDVETLVREAVERTEVENVTEGTREEIEELF